MLTADFAEPDYAGIRRNVRTAIMRKRVVRSTAAITVLAAAAALIAIFVRPPHPASLPVAHNSAPAQIVAAAEPSPQPAPVHRVRIRRPIAPIAEQPRIAMYIATRNPKVTILLLQAKQEVSNE